MTKLFVRDRVFYSRAARITLPIALQSLITIGVNMMDTIMLGSFGEIPISASSLANQVIVLFNILCLGIGGGAAVVTAQCWGRQDILGLKKVTTLALRIVFFSGLVFTVATLLFPEQIMAVFTTEEAVIQSGVRYFEIMAFTYIIQGMTTVVTIVERSYGVVKIALYSSIGSFGINIFFNWMFIFGKLGAPAMEIAGAALGTLIARVFEMAFIVGYFLVVDKKVCYRIRDLFGECRSCLHEYLHYSVPVIVSDSLLALGNSAVAIVMGRIGAAFVAANAIVAIVQQLSTVFISGLSSASSVMIGNVLGEGDKQKAYEQGVTFFSLSTIVGLAAGGIIVLLGPTIVGYYNVVAETREIAIALMDAVGFIVIFQAISSVMTKGVLRGGGDTKFLMAADILFLWVASVPLGALAAFVWELGPFWIYCCLKMDMIIKTFWCIQRLISKKWMRTIATGCVKG